MPCIGNENELVRALGYPAFKRLVQILGGHRIRVPSTIERAERLVQTLGRDGAAQLVDAFGGFDIEVPNGRPTALPSREAMIKQMIRSGWSNQDIIENTRCTERSVRRYRADMKLDTRPGGNRQPSDVVKSR